MGATDIMGISPPPQPHLICIKCKKIVAPKLDLDDMKNKIANETHFKILSHRLDFLGYLQRLPGKKSINIFFATY
jgi:Fur family peroxide stress response transcriptional regulator